MSQVARVFVVLNLLIAAGFLFAAATFLSLNSDWKGKFTTEEQAHRADNAANQTIIGEKEAEISRLGVENAGLKEQRGKLETSGMQKDSEIARLTSELATKGTEIAALVSTNQTQANAVTALRNDLEQQRQRAEAAGQEARAKTEEAAQAVMAKETAEQTIEELRGQVHEGEKALTSAREQISNLDMMKAYAQSLGVSFDNVAIMPSLNGVVAQTDGRSLVQVNLGSAAGVQKGFTMDIVRNGNYIGRVKIDTVFGNSSAGQLTIRAPGETVRVGDRVFTNLN